MKNLLAFMILGLFVISMIGVVSAKTLVAGIVYNEDYSQPIEGASVNVKCFNSSDTLQGEGNTTTLSDGTYAIEFSEIGSSNNCVNGDKAVVTATKDAASGSNYGFVQDYGATVKLAIVNISIPEFGLVLGIITLVACVGIFFFVKKH